MEPIPISKLSQTIQELKTQQPQLSELYSDIILSDEVKNEVIEKALFEARYAEHARLNAIAYREKLNAPMVVKRYSADDLFSQLKEESDRVVGSVFTIDDDNREIIKTLCEYFTDDPRFEKRGYSLGKGLLMFGAVGVGKTFLMNLFRNNQKQSYQTVSCQDVEGVYSRNGDDQNEKTGETGLRRFYGLITLSTNNQYGHNTLGYLFDDLGQENTATKYFGTERNVMIEVLSQRYKNKFFPSTHLTTNLSADQIKEIYGARVADRMKEMFNLISFPESAKSRRK
jgi:DNA replication protein DnaC